LGVFVVKDGCSPQGQCGCCTVLVDGQPRVACVTPLSRVRDRKVVTADGLEPATRQRLVEAFITNGAAQCGFCTPGILCRLAGLAGRPSVGRKEVQNALLAHLCRCTGWQGIVEAALVALRSEGQSQQGPGEQSRQAVVAEAAALRATLEGHAAQRVGADVVSGRGGFAADTRPPGCLVAVPDPQGGWSVGTSLREARSAVASPPGRNSGRSFVYPVAPPEGEWPLTLQTTWVEPAYLEPDASWCEPGGSPWPPAGNGGDFGAKGASLAPLAAKELAELHGQPVLVSFSRPDVVRLGAKRPPIGAGLRPDGTGVICFALGEGPPGCEGTGSDEEEALRQAVGSVSRDLEVRFVRVAGPRTSAGLRATGWAEAWVLANAAQALSEGRVPSAADRPAEAVATARGPEGGEATAWVSVDQQGQPTQVKVLVSCGQLLAEPVARSYMVGAAHMALSWVCSEALSVDARGIPADSTMRSFGVLRAVDTPPIEVSFADQSAPACNGSDSVFAAVAAATWIAQGLPPRWPTLRRRS